MSDAVYRFLPWSRRGLAASVPGSDDGAPVPARPEVAIDVVVGGAGTVSTGTTLYGPGDVIGLDPTVIVRTVPRANATNVEPNYLVAVDFDQPELPWAFTPTGVPSSGRLRPWLVLVVVRDRPGVSLTVPGGAALPHLTIDSGAAEELPDLADSWAWAHAQLLDADAGTTPQAVGAALADRPDRNVSRLVCPRRLAPDTRWIACLVPAFDTGVVRGLGGEPRASEAQPAWTSPDAITLPVYYHWRFQTGPQGDFEALARRLTPYEAGARIGRVPMHIGDASPFVRLPSGDPARFLDMDGALRAPAAARAAADPPVPEPSLGEVPHGVRSGLAEVTRVLADAADGALDGQAPESGSALGPPVYTGAHIRRTWVGDTDAAWFRELNTDPRCRVAAGLGAEVMRTYQDDVVEACWQQVGDVLAVEAALSRARLSVEAGLRFRLRHLDPLPAGRLFQLTAPLADRTLLDGTTLPAAIEPTSLPAGATDAAMRRYTAATGRVLAGVRRRAARTAVAVAARRAGQQLVSTLAQGRPDVDPTRFPVFAIDGLEGRMPPATEDGTVALGALGVGLTVDQATATALAQASQELRASLVLPAHEMMRPRADLYSTGLLTDAHLQAAREAAAETLAAKAAELGSGGQLTVTDVLSSSSSRVVDAVAATAAAAPGDVGFLVETGSSWTVRSLGLSGGNRIVALTPADADNVPVAYLDIRLHGDAGEVGDMVGRLPHGTLNPLTRDRAGRLVAPTPVELRPGASVGDVLGGPVGATTPVTVPAGTAATVTMPPLVKDAASVARYESAVTELVERTALGQDPVVPVLVPFALPAASAAILDRVAPLTVHPARLDSMIRLAGHGLTAVAADVSLVPGWQLPANVDRVMAHPRLDLPAYTYLAAYDRTRFCPGVDEVPPESVTLLETHPRFIAAFMAGLNHETNQELLWRGYPTDGRGTPWQKFWKRTDGGPDIFEIAAWGPRAGRDDLPAQTSDARSNLVLLLRGDLIRRYPNTMVVAVRAVPVAGGEQPSSNTADLRVPMFAGQFDPDVSFFGFPLVSDDLTTGDGWFFGLMEPVTEPRFGFDETVGRTTAGPAGWNDVAWPDLRVEPAGMLPVSRLTALGIGSPVDQADAVAAALFQRPFKLLVHARHLVKGL
ncbi:MULTISPECIES: hypothetical protein [Streptomyces]|uniref:hypothetical protein n=1 Tax=Streptomyces TaxID=1883 RepID=UPI00345BDA3A